MGLEFETSEGTVEIRSAMIDIDGTNLEQALEVKIDNEHRRNVFDVSIDELNKDNIEDFLNEHIL